MRHVHSTFSDMRRLYSYLFPYLIRHQRMVFDMPPLLCMQILDAVVCDPPYGVRAGGRKSQSKPDLQVRDRTTHITSTAPYGMGALSHCPILLPLWSGTQIGQE